jgi:chromate reductase, NAD(P)H dehydrogenase (quinone)
MATQTKKIVAARRIVGLTGSLRAGSVNRRLLAAVAHELPADVTLEVWDGLEEVPPFNEDLEGGPVPVAVAELRSLINGADGVLIATPEYNGSVPGQLKNALDWASRPRGAAVLEGMPVATLSASPSRRGGDGAQADLRKVLGVIGAELRGEEIAVPRIHEQFDEDGGLVDQGLRAHLHSTVAALIGPRRNNERAGASADTCEPATNASGTGRLTSSNGKAGAGRRSFDVCGAQTQHIRPGQAGGFGRQSGGVRQDSRRATGLCGERRGRPGSRTPVRA